MRSLRQALILTPSKWKCVVVAVNNPNNPTFQSHWPKHLPCKIAVVGEAPGVEEEKAGQPFIGPSGQLLDKLLADAGIDKAECLITNVFFTRPLRNDVEQFFVKINAISAQLKSLGYTPKQIKEFAATGGEGLPDNLNWFKFPKYGTAGYLDPQHIHHLERLRAEITKSGAKIVIALGNTALWALCHLKGISSYRGTWQQCWWDPSIKVMPTYHPAAVLREWSYRPIVQSDLSKVGKGPVTPPSRHIWVAEKLADLATFRPLIGTRIALDVEEEGTRQITSFSISASPRAALVVPIFDAETGVNAWTEEDEIEVWLWLQEILSDSSREVVLHNCLYDLTHLFHHYGIRVCGPVLDTMLMHHAYSPESSKSLGELASLYCDETAWKTIRTWSKKKETKAHA
jgi:uracil-DNA glycosylase